MEELKREEARALLQIEDTEQSEDDEMNDESGDQHRSMEGYNYDDGFLVRDSDESGGEQEEP